MLRLSPNNGSQRTNKVIHTHINTCRARPLCATLGPEAWKGRKCFLIGGGPSLEDPYFGSAINKIIAAGELTIGVNKSFVYGTTLNYAMDELFYNLVTDPNGKLYKAWQAYQGMKIFIQRSKQMRFDTSVFYVHAFDRKLVSFDISQGIYPGTNSGMGAIMLACALGCKKIGLLGYDLAVRPADGRTHWHEGYAHQSPAEVPGTLDGFRLAIEEFVDAWKINNVDIVNFNLNSSLRCFRFSSVEDFLEEKIE